MHESIWHILKMSLNCLKRKPQVLIPSVLKYALFLAFFAMTSGPLDAWFYGEYDLGPENSPMRNSEVGMLYAMIFLSVYAPAYLALHVFFQSRSIQMAADAVSRDNTRRGGIGREGAHRRTVWWAELGHYIDMLLAYILMAGAVIVLNGVVLAAARAMASIAPFYRLFSSYSIDLLLLFYIAGLVLALLAFHLIFAALPYAMVLDDSGIFMGIMKSILFARNNATDLLPIAVIQGLAFITTLGVIGFLSLYYIEWVLLLAIMAINGTLMGSLATIWRTMIYLDWRGSRDETVPIDR